MSESSYNFSTQHSKKGKHFQGGEQKVMRKSLSLLLAFAMVFTMFAGVALADDSAKAKLANAGVIQGSLSGDTLDDQEWTREQLTVILSRLFGVEEEAKATEKDHTFADVTDPYWDGFITWAKNEGLFNGHSDVRFGYNESATFQQFVTVLLRALEVDFDYADAVATAVEAGIIGEAVDNDEPVLRGDSYDVIVNTLNSEVAEGVTLGAKLGLTGWVAEAGAAVLAQTGAKKLAVTFNKPSGDAQFSVKRGNLDINVKEVSWNDAKTVATLELHSNLPEAKHTVTVGGVDLGEDGNVLTIDTVPSKVAEINYESTYLVKDAANDNIATVGYAVLNQFGEDVTNTSSLQESISPSVHDLVVNPGNKTITVDKDALIQVNEVYVITLVDTAGSTTVASQTFTVVNPATVASINIGDLKNNDNKELISNTDITEDVFYFPIDALDQYGNKVSNLANLNSGTTIVGVGDKYKLSFATIDNAPALKLVPESGKNIEAGTYTFTVVANGTGQSATVQFTVTKAAELTTFNLLAPDEELFVNEDINIPFQALDQDGNELTKFDDLSGKLELSTTRDDQGAKITLVKNPVDGTASVKLEAGTKDGNLYLTSIVKDKPSVSHLTVGVGKEAFPATINGIKDTQLKLTNGATSTIEFKHLVVVDQYGREMDELKGYTLVATPNDGSTNVTISDNVIGAGSDKFVLAGSANNGSTSFTVTIYDNATPAKAVSGSEFGFTAETIKKSDIVSYEVADIGKIHSSKDYTSSSAYAKEVEVYGLTANGDKVALAPGYVSSVQAAGVSFDSVNSKVYAKEGEIGKDTFTRTGSLIFIIDAANGLETVTKSVEYTNEALVATSIAPKAKDGRPGINDGVTILTSTEANGVYDLKNASSNLFFEVKDQFGQSLQSELTFAAVSKKDGSSATVGISGTTLTISGSASGDEITVTGVTKNGLVATVRIIVND